jgi:hypothetical protein
MSGSAAFAVAWLIMVPGAHAATSPVFVSSESPHFVFHYVEGSAADRELPTIVANREKAYAAVAAALEAPAGAKIEISLYPDRESTPSGYGAGSTSKDVISVNYFDFTPHYEQTRYGHELTHALTYRALRGQHSVPLLSEGLAEYLDQSGRNQHEVLSDESRALGSRRPIRIESEDLRSSPELLYPKGGSFVQFLIEDSGWPKFRKFYAATQGIGRLFPRDQLSQFSKRYEEVYGKTLADAEADWNKAVEAFDAKSLPQLTAEDEAAVRALFATQDAAAAAGDARAFAETYDRVERKRIKYFEGNLRYYMDRLRATKIVAVDDLGIKKGRRASVRATREFKNAGTRNIEYSVEKLEDGWKILDEDWR